ncbi:CHRD domain-containing protein [Leptolyngbya sp. CCNP1308]|uniref:CHRD domain-containing protein n=1 Tax=Leptolyngbya sp. CCNP1308 TaxID=3110255 RepID=UPI002B20D7F9|nr:CHRD domain-containing protein [Leptolyngbya sp. CCNP1308]MEA5447747.1 CHRD domain-containing protein [Leptolyngbya sp. CCNP1308]
MFRERKNLRNGLIALATCLFVTVLYSPVMGRVMAQAPAAVSAASWSTASSDTFALGEQIDANLTAATAPLLAQGLNEPIVTYIAMLSGQNVVPKAAMTDARGVVGAALSGNRLVVRGSFRELTSAPRDYATDPLDPPNPSITSAFHVHQGSPSENGPFQYALDVTLNANGRGGSAMGDYTLTPEQLQALQNGMLYVDFHTTRYRAGELRGILMPA